MSARACECRGLAPICAQRLLRRCGGRGSGRREAGESSPPVLRAQANQKELPKVRDRLIHLHDLKV
jgi:hypothetical protein